MLWLALQIAPTETAEAEEPMLAQPTVLAALTTPIAPSAPAEAVLARSPALLDVREASRRSRLIELPSGGTPILTVRDGKSVELFDAPGGKRVAKLGDTTEFDSPTVLTVLERKGNWVGVPTQLLPNGKLAWMKLESGRLEFDSVGQEIVVDVSAHRARLLRNGKAERSWNVSVGAPGSPTPTGSFSVTDSIEGGLNPVYGCCALALSATQPSPPEGWTGGNRMAIHGTLDEVGLDNSAGCVRSSDEDMSYLVDKVPVGTPVTIFK